MAAYKELAGSYSYLTNKDLLLRLDSQILTEQTVRIILLDTADQILEENGIIQTVEGEVVQGNLTVNGKSSVRRAGSLTLIATEENCKVLDPANKISIKTRFALEIGITDMLTGIVYYFPLGVFCATGVSIQRSLTGYTISLTFKDKMVLLNGELGGTFPAAVDLHQEVLPDGTVQKVAITTTIIQMIRDYSDVVLNNIIEKDAASEGVQVSGLADTTFATKYLTADNIEFDAVVESEVSWIGKNQIYKLNGQDNAMRQIALFTDLDNATKTQNKWENAGLSTTLTAHNYGAPIGYQKTLFSFPGELSANSGDNIVTILEKIKNTVATNHEFYFDVLGDFHFEKMKHNLLGEKDAEGNPKEYDVAYVFDENSPMISSYQNNPNYAALKNDFVIWGERSTASGIKQGIMYHQVFSTPPTPEITAKVIAYKENEFSTGYKWKLDEINGIEVTAQHYMEQLYLEGLSGTQGPARAYFAELHAFIGNLVDLTANDDVRREQWEALEKGGKTSVNYWLEFIDVNTSDIPGIRNLDIAIIGKKTLSKNEKAVNCIAKMPVDNIYIQQVNDSDDSDNILVVTPIIDNDTRVGSQLELIVSEDLFPKDEMVVILLGEWNGEQLELLMFETVDAWPPEQSITYTDNKVREQPYRARLIAKTTGDMKDIDGQENKNDENDIILLQVSDKIAAALALGAVQYSAEEYLRGILHNHISYCETININSLPIYYLEPNCCIQVQDEETSISGKYILNSYSIPLSISGTMNLSCSRALEMLTAEEKEMVL